MAEWKGLEFTQTPDRWPHLMRMWGADAGVVAERFGLRFNESEHVLAVWFPTTVARDAFKAAIHDVVNVVRDPHDGGDGDPASLTGVEVWLRLPNGQEVTYRDTFGYGYPPDSAEFMYVEGNYSCDCNRALFAARQRGLPEPEETACGNTITLARLRVYQIRPDGTEATIHDLVDPEAPDAR